MMLLGRRVALLCAAVMAAGSLLDAVVDLDGLLDICLQVLCLGHVDERGADLVLESTFKLIHQRLVLPSELGCNLLELGGVVKDRALLLEVPEAASIAAKVLAETVAKLCSEEVVAGHPCRWRNLVAVDLSPSVGLVSEAGAGIG